MNTPSLDSITAARSPASEKLPPARWQRRVASAIPWLLLLGFGLLAWLLFGDRLLPATPVAVETVVTVRQSGETAAATAANSSEPQDPFEATALFQASGWVEPDPLPIKATALVNGVVESVAVLEGESVTKDQLLAKLIPDDFELDLATAESELKSLKAQAKAHEAAIRVAEAKIQTLLKKVEAGEMRCLELEDRRDRLTNVTAGAVAESEVVQAKLILQTHVTEIEALEATREELVSDKARLEATREEFAANIQRAETEVSRRQLALDRTEIRSPVDAIVLRLLAVPGQKQMLAMDDPDSATVAILYQPDSLQARIDVPLAEAARLSVGQAVRLRSSFLSDHVFRGKVTRIVGEADLQRNTLQVKVRIEEPDRRLRPEMLCRAEFLAAVTNGDGDKTEESNTSPNRTGERIALFAPERALFDRNENHAAAWTLDSSGQRLERRSLTIDSETREGHLGVREGLRPGDRVVIDPSEGFSEGQRVRIQSKEETP